jgi:chromosome segregation ATPase
MLDVLAERERELLTLKSKQDSVKSKAEQMQSRLEEALAAKGHEMERLMKELDRERTKGPSMMIESLVSKLKVQLTGKDKKLSQLKEAIRQLEARLIDAMKATATGDMNQSQVRTVRTQRRSAAGGDWQEVVLGHMRGQGLHTAEGLRCTRGGTDEGRPGDTTPTAASSGCGYGGQPTSCECILTAPLFSSLSQVRSVEAQAAQADSLQEQVAILKEKLAKAKDEGAKTRGAAEARGRDAERLAVDLARSEAAAKAMAAELARSRKKAGPPSRMSTKAVSTDSGKVEQLEKRIAVLTSQNQKLSKMLKADGGSVPTMAESTAALEGELLEKTRTIVKLERQLEKAGGAVESKSKGGSLLSGNANLEQWEAGKALQKKVDTLRKRLEEKTKRLEQEEKAATKLRSDLAEALSDKERLRSGRARAAATAEPPSPENKRYSLRATQPPLSPLVTSPWLTHPLTLVQVERRGAGGGGGEAEPTAAGSRGGERSVAAHRARGAGAEHPQAGGAGVSRYRDVLGANRGWGAR